MGRFEILTKHIEPLKNEKEYGYPINREGKRVTKEEDLYYYDKNNTKVYTPPFYEYSDTVKSFTRDLVNFIFDTKNGDILPIKDVRTKDIKFDEKKIFSLDAASVLLLLNSPIKWERFCDGLLLRALENGRILKLLERLKEIDENQN